MKLISFVFTAFLVLGAFFSCNDSTNISSGDIVFPDSNVSYQNHVRPFLQYNCSYQGCHSEESAAGDRIMTEYYFLFDVNNIGLININDPDASLLVQIIEDKFEHYPSIRWFITENQKKGIRRWIEEGALNN